MNDYLLKLNDKQYSACTDTEGPSLIVAGAGSGKTRVLTSRIAYLIGEKNVDPMSILAITFTNKAAKEMKERLINLVGSDAGFITCKTFHSFCAEVLRREISVLPRRKSSFQIIDDDESETLIRNVIIALNYDVKLIKPKMIASEICAIKAKIKSFDDFGDYFREKIESIFNAYNEELIKNNLVDFDDLIYLTIEIFTKYPYILERYQEYYRYLLVDEFQDTSNIQYELIYLLGAKYMNVFIVGDEDQSIYSFRGANIANIRKFMDDFRGYHQHVLDENYRSTSKILDCANKLISHNKNRIPKNLWTSKTGGDDVSLYYYDSDKAEARAIAQIIKKNVSSGKYKYQDFAILYRNNHLSRNFENELLQNRIPYRVYSGLSFYKRKEVKDMMSYLRLTLNPDDIYSYKRVINTPKRGIGDTTMSKVEREVDSTGLPLSEAIKSADIQRGVRETLLSFNLMIEDLRKELKSLDLKDFFKKVYKDSGYEDFIESIEDEIERDARRENIKELYNAISEVQSIDNLEETLSDFLQNVSLLSDNDIESQDPNHVSLITMHSAKGLEYKNVFATCLEEDIIPGTRIMVESDKEEERRLLYVCLTRAKEHLFISCARSRYKFGTPTLGFPSMFLKELELKPRTERDDVIKASKSSVTQYQRRDIPVGDIEVGARVNHKMFGKGTIKGQIEGFYIIKFDDNPTPKKVIVGHPLLSRDE